MEDQGSFDEFLSRLNEGDEEAARQVFDRFARRLAAMTRRRLDPRLRRKVDPDDVLQSAYRSFFARCSRGGFDPGGWEGLWGVLAVITRRRCLHWVEHYHAGRRDIDAEVPCDPDRAGPAPGREPVSREPTPEEAAIGAESLERWLGRLGPRGRTVVALHLEGLSVAEVARRVAVSERTIQRALRDASRRLEEEVGEGEGAGAGAFPGDAGPPPPRAIGPPRGGARP